MEYRFVVQTDHPEPIFVRVKQAFRAVILGADVSHLYEPAFAKVCDPAGIEIFYMGSMGALTSRPATTRLRREGDRELD